MDQLIKAEVIMRLVTGEDFVYWQDGERTILHRQRIYVRTDNKLECYTPSQWSDKSVLRQLIHEGRVFIPAQEDLSGTTTGRVINDAVDVAA